MNSRTGSLADIKVIDASRVLGGPYAGQILGDHGADVIKIEPPAGDETRGWGPPFLDGAASYFLGLNRNKRGMALDLTQEAGRELLLRLLETADVFIENFKTGTLERWGLGREELERRFPRLVHCRISGFGADGPLGGLPGYDAAIQASAGIMSVNGELGGEPLRVGLPVVDMVTGLNAVIGILMALQERASSGKGQFVEATLYDCGVSLLHPHLPNYTCRERSRGVPATPIPTSPPTTSSPRAMRRSSWPSATTGNSPRSARSSAGRSWRRTRATRPTRIATSIATRSRPIWRPRWPVSTAARWPSAWSSPACPAAPSAISTR